MDADPVDLVRSGYNSISRTYRGDDDPAREYGPWLAGRDGPGPSARLLRRRRLPLRADPHASQRFVPEG
jgi:hypothetical protein